MFRLLIFFSVLLASQSVYASTNNGKIIQILLGPNQGNKVFIVMDGSPVNASCHTNSGIHYVFDGGTESGKMTLSVVLSAYVAQKNVTAKGLDTCTLHSGVEDLANILIR